MIKECELKIGDNVLICYGDDALILFKTVVEFEQSPNLGRLVRLMGEMNFYPCGNFKDNSYYPLPIFKVDCE